LIYDILNSGAPATVRPLPGFIDDLNCLVKIFDSASAPVIILRAVFIFLIVYGFGDAYGKSFGSTFSGRSDISYQIGTLADDESR
jgi:hypothetical protein